MDNKNIIILCSTNLFYERGYDSVSVQEICDSAGITKPTLYHYFGNKEGVFKEVMESGYKELFDNILPFSSYNGDLPLTLHRLTGTYFNFADQHDKFYSLNLSAIYAPPVSIVYEIVKPYLDRQIEMFQKIFLEASKDHGNMKNRHVLYSISFFGMINSFIELYLKNYIKLNEETTFKAVHQFMHGIYS